MARETAAQAFERVRQTYFPRWDRSREWKCRKDARLPSMGMCRDDRRKIVLQYLPTDTDELDLLVIHEVCHAVAGCGHGVPWLRRMRELADRAESLGRQRLAGMLREEVDRYEEASAIRAEFIYMRIEEVVTAQPTPPDFRVLMEWMAREYGSTARWLMEKYTRCRRVYDAACREAARGQKLRELREMERG